MPNRHQKQINKTTRNQKPLMKITFYWILSPQTNIIPVKNIQQLIQKQVFNLNLKLNIKPNDSNISLPLEVNRDFTKHLSKEKN